MTAFVALAAMWGVYWPRAIERPLLHGPAGDVLADPDSYMQWRLVHRALDGGTVRVRWVNDDNAPWGRLNEWTSPTTLVGATALRVARFFTRRSIADVDPLVRTWLGPTLALVTVIGLAGFGRVAGGWTTAGCWAIAWPVSAAADAMTRCGSVNRQALNELIFSFVVACVVAGRSVVDRSPDNTRRASGWGASAGVLCGLALWAAASELLPMWFAVAGLAIWDCAGGSPEQPAAVTQFWRAWVATGLLTTAAALLFEFGPGSPAGGPGLFHRHLEFLSAWHVGLWIGAAIPLLLKQRTVTSRRALAWRRVLLIGVPIVWAAVTALIFRGFRMHDLHVVQDSRFQDLIRVVAEFQPYSAAGIEPTLRAFLTDFGLLPLALLALLGLAKTLPTQWRWLLLCTAMFAGLTGYEMRWGGELLALLVMGAGYAAVARWGDRPVLAIGVIVVAIVPLWAFEVPLSMNIDSLNGDGTQGPCITQMALEAAAQDLAEVDEAAPASASTGRDTRPIVLTSWDWGGTLAGTGKVRVVGSQYWSNLAGFSDTLDLYTEPSTDRFQAMVRKRGIEYFIVPDASTMTQAVLSAFAARWGTVPTAAQVGATAIWHVAADLQRPNVPAPRLLAIEPQWRIVRLR